MRPVAADNFGSGTLAVIQHLCVSPCSMRGGLLQFFTAGTILGKKSPLRHSLRRATSPRGGGKFADLVVKASCLGACLSVIVAVPHPSRLRRSPFPPGEGVAACRRWQWRDCYCGNCPTPLGVTRFDAGWDTTVFYRRNDTEQGKAVTITDAPGTHCQPPLAVSSSSCCRCSCSRRRCCRRSSRRAGSAG